LTQRDAAEFKQLPQNIECDARALQHPHISSANQSLTPDFSEFACTRKVEFLQRAASEA